MKNLEQSALRAAIQPLHINIAVLVIKILKYLGAHLNTIVTSGSLSNTTTEMTHSRAAFTIQQLKDLWGHHKEL